MSHNKLGHDIKVWLQNCILICNFVDLFILNQITELSMTRFQGLFLSTITFMRPRNIPFENAGLFSFYVEIEFTNWIDNIMNQLPQHCHVCCDIASVYMNVACLLHHILQSNPLVF